MALYQIYINMWSTLSNLREYLIVINVCHDTKNGWNQVTIILRRQLAFYRIYRLIYRIHFIGSWIAAASIYHIHIYNDFRYSCRLYTEYVGQLVSYIYKIPSKVNTISPDLTWPEYTEWFPTFQLNLDVMKWFPTFHLTLNRCLSKYVIFKKKKLCLKLKMNDI